MNYPKTPDDSRDWRSIDIFLFTNGQEYSPPRKYHLKTEELKLWDATLTFLARSQFGSLHSNIELYTLDGKKINTPLELVNDTAYVAVNPPDTFVQSGYEKYLLKASRSREKRHEKLNKTEITKSGNIDINKEQVKSNFNVPKDLTNNNGDKIDDKLCLDTEYLTTVDNNTQSPKYTNSLKQNKTTNNSLRIEKPELFQKKKPGNNTKNTILKKIYPDSKVKEDGCNLYKKRTTSFSRTPIKAGGKNTNILKTNLEDKIKTKDEPQINNIRTVENITDTNEKNEQLRNVLSDVYENTESDVQFVFLDTDRKTALLSNVQRKVPSVSENIYEFGESLEANKAMYQLSANNLSNSQAPCTKNQPSTFNINLSIDLKGYTAMTTEEKKSANKYKTFITLVKPEKATQVDVNLGRETLNLGDENLPQNQSVESDIANTYEEKVGDNQTNVIVHCKCNIFKSDNNTSSPYNFKENDHYFIVIPTERIDKFMPRGDLETVHGSDKEIQELLHSCIRVPLTSNSEIVSNKKHEHVTKQKVSIISQDATKEHNKDNVLQHKSQGDIIQPTLINDLNKHSYTIENFSQTDWCNTLLQAKCHDDGRYTFHLPPLHLLTHYNLL